MTPLEVAEVVAAYHNRTERERRQLAYRVAELVGALLSDGLPPLSEVLDPTPEVQPSRAAYHEVLKNLGLE